MPFKGPLRAAFLVFSAVSGAFSAAAPLCTEGARAMLACEVRFEWQGSEVADGGAAYGDEVLNVEFRSPSHKTVLMHEFWDGGHTLRVRFTPTEAGAWVYRVSSSIPRFDNQEANFNVAESGEAGPVNVANLRHWRSANKKPHLWLAAAVPLLEIDQTNLESWLDARKKDGFTHIRGTLLTAGAANKPFSKDYRPNAAYFNALDEKVLAAANRGFTLDLILMDGGFAQGGIMNQREKLDPLIRYLTARYGGLNVTWQGIEHFEDIAGARGFLRDIGLLLQKYDGYKHPRSTDARVSSSPLAGDGWMNYLIEASPRPELAAVEHQFTEQPEIHVITTTEPAAFRHELWNSTTNGEYPSVSYESLRNEANVKAVKTWFSVISDTRHWELEPYFDADGARAIGLDEVEYLAYAEKPGIVEIKLPKHKYNPVWVNPATGEEIPLKDYRGDVFSRQTPDNERDWVLQVPREGLKESMARDYYFESQDPPVQEVESDAAKIPYDIADPPGDSLNTRLPAPFSVKLVRANRATRVMQYVWWGEVVAGGEGARVLGIGPSGNFTIPASMVQAGAPLNVRLLAINANGKAYELDKVYNLQ